MDRKLVTFDNKEFIVFSNISSIKLEHKEIKVKMINGEVLTYNVPSEVPGNCIVDLFRFVGIHSNKELGFFSPSRYISDKIRELNEVLADKKISFKHLLECNGFKGKDDMKKLMEKSMRDIECQTDLLRKLNEEVG